MEFLRWQVVAECEALNNGKTEKFDRVIAAFSNPINAEDFINNCLPKERKDKFRIEHID